MPHLYTVPRIFSNRRRPSSSRRHCFGLFFLPFGPPLPFASVIHLGGRPRRFPWLYDSRSNTAMASTS
jgi:hypothetical protein